MRDSVTLAVYKGHHSDQKSIHVFQKLLATMAADTEGGVHPEAGEIKVNTVMGENTDEEGYQLEDEPELVKQARRRAERRNETIKKFLGLGSDEFAANAICRE